MKTIQLFAAALVAFSSLPMLALQADASAQAAGPAPVAVEMRPVNAELVNKLDAKSAKAGESASMSGTGSAPVVEPPASSCRRRPTRRPG